MVNHRTFTCVNGFTKRGTKFLRPVHVPIVRAPTPSIDALVAMHQFSCFKLLLIWFELTLCVLLVHCREGNIGLLFGLKCLLPSILFLQSISSEH